MRCTGKHARDVSPSARGGVMGVHQMGHVGGDHGWWTNAPRNGRWEQMSTRVLRADGAPDTMEPRSGRSPVSGGSSTISFGPTSSRGTICTHRSGASADVVDPAPH